MHMNFKYSKIIMYLTVIGVMFAGVLFKSTPAYAYEIPEYDTVLEDEVKEAVEMGDYAAGMVDFRLAVHKNFYSYNYMTVGFFEVNKHYYVEYDFTDYTQEYKYEKLMPCGTYVLSYVEFSDPVINMNFLCNPEQFTVDENGYSDNIWINVDYTQTNTVNIQNVMSVNDGKGFEGYLHMTYYDKTDTEFNQDEKYDMDQDSDYVQRIQIFHVAEENPTKYTNILTAGDICISNINVYDKDKNPLNVYYDPNYFTLDRSMSFDNESNEQSIYVFADKSELTDEQLNTIEEKGFVLKKASDMDKYYEMENEQFNVYKGESPLFTIYNGDIPAGEPGNKIVAPVETEEEISVDEPEVKNVAPVEHKKNFFSFDIIMFIVIVAVIGTIVFVTKKRKNN